MKTVKTVSTTEKTSFGRFKTTFASHIQYVSANAYATANTVLDIWACMSKVDALKKAIPDSDNASAHEVEEAKQALADYLASDQYKSVMTSDNIALENELQSSDRFLLRLMTFTVTQYDTTALYNSILDGVSFKDELKASCNFLQECLNASTLFVSSYHIVMFTGTLSGKIKNGADKTHTKQLQMSAEEVFKGLQYGEFSGTAGKLKVTNKKKVNQQLALFLLNSWDNAPAKREEK